MTTEAAERLYFRHLAPNDLPDVWEAILPLIERACQYTDDELAPEMIVDGVLTGKMQLLCLHDGAKPHSIMVTMGVRPACAPAPRLEAIAVSGSDPDAWMPFEKEMDALALAMGCDRVRIKGRPGWGRKLQHWKVKALIMERRIDGRPIDA